MRRLYCVGLVLLASVGYWIDAFVYVVVASPLERLKVSEPLIVDATRMVSSLG